MPSSARSNGLENRGYADNGIQAFKEAAAAFMKRQFGVTLDPVTEVNHCIGSKPALAMLPACFINPGDVTLMTVPGYPVAGTHTAYYGGEVYKSAAARGEWLLLPISRRSRPTCRRRAKLLVINYPNSPTGATATTRLLRQVIDFAQTNQVIVVQDAAHILLTYDGPPTSFLQVDGAQGGRRRGAFAVEGIQHDRLAHGWVCRPSEDGASVRRRQGQLRFGPVHGDPAGGARWRWSIRKSATATREKYRRRLQKLVAACEAGRLPGEDAERNLFPLRRGAEGAAVAAPSPTRRRCRSFSSREQSVCCVPWDDAGAFLRFSVTYLAKDEAEEDALMRETVERLGRLQLQF